MHQTDNYLLDEIGLIDPLCMKLWFNNQVTIDIPSNPMLSWKKI